jgi:UDP-N-acetylmuramoylalanine--D-glutamate ligase
VPPAGSYAESPFDILSYQTYNNFIIGNDAVIDATHAEGYQTRAKMLRTKASLVPAEWKIQSRGNHDRDNAALALQAGRLFKVGDDTARRLLEAWKPLRGRLEPVKKLKGVEFCNDTGSISPDSTLTALMCLSEGRNVVLIFGGADSGADYRRLYAALPHYAHSLIVIPGSGTVRERKTLEHLDRVEVKSVPSVEAAVRLAMEQAKKGDKILFSPGFEAGGLDGSRKDRGERFVRAVRAL